MLPVWHRATKMGDARSESAQPDLLHVTSLMARLGLSNDEKGRGVGPGSGLLLLYLTDTGPNFWGGAPWGPCVLRVLSHAPLALGLSCLLFTVHCSLFGTVTHTHTHIRP